MGVVFKGTLLEWEEHKKQVDYIREHGIIQFINHYNRTKDRHDDPALWGDEIESTIVTLDHEKKTARLALVARQAVPLLQALRENADPEKAKKIPHYLPEANAYIIEHTPAEPLTVSFADLLTVEADMVHRRQFMRQFFKPNQVPLTVTFFPRFGAAGPFTDPHIENDTFEHAHSLFVGDNISYGAARYTAGAIHIRLRRECKPEGNIPVFFDTHTPKPFIDPTIPWDRNLHPEDQDAKNGHALPNHVYTDAFMFAMGACCLQVTMQGKDINEARRLYDAFIPVAPIVMALTAATPVLRGWLTDRDGKWDVLSASLDDRNPEERGLRPLKEGQLRIPKSRYGSVDMYLAIEPEKEDVYNDIYVPYVEKFYNQLRENGIDHLLAKHIAHLFIRHTAGGIFSEMLHQDDNTSILQFEDHQSSNWQSVRFKPPPQNPNIGWRVEVRSMEIMPTDFENAAFSIFNILLARTILHFDLNMYMPISEVDKNMATGQLRDAVNTQKFFFRKDLGVKLSENGNAQTQANGVHPEGPVTAEMTLDEIINGKAGGFVGLLPLIWAYIEVKGADKETKEKLAVYLDVVKGRASGQLKTAATWIREFIRSHPAYKFDSAVSEEITYDLMVAIDELNRGVRDGKGLFKF